MAKTKKENTSLSAYILLDRTGSMSTRWSEALSSVNAYVNQLEKDKTKGNVTLALFDRHAGGIQFDVIRDKQAPSDWKPVSNDDASPRGDTPLYDAVGRLVNLAEKEDSKKTILVIMTDGEENASQEFTRDSAKAALARCKDKGWQVVFLGADFDTISQAQGVGVAMQNSLNMSAGNYRSVAQTLATKSMMYATADCAVSFSAEDRKNATLTKPTS